MSRNISGISYFLVILPDVWLLMVFGWSLYKVYTKWNLSQEFIALELRKLYSQPVLSESFLDSGSTVTLMIVNSALQQTQGEKMWSLPVQRRHMFG